MLCPGSSSRTVDIARLDFAFDSSFLPSSGARGADLRGGLVPVLEAVLGMLEI